MSGAVTLVEQLTTIAKLEVEAASFKLPHDFKRITANAQAQDEARRVAAIDDRAQRPEVSPLYLSIDDGELVGAYAPVGITAQGMALGLLDLLAKRAADDAPVALSHIGSVNWRLLLRVIGEAAIKPMMATLLDALRSNRIDHVRLERRDWPIDEDGEEIVGVGEPPLLTGPIDGCWEGWEEIGFTSCAADDQDARAIVQVDIDEDLLSPLIALIAERGAAAKRVLRGEPPA